MKRHGCIYEHLTNKNFQKGYVDFKNLDSLNRPTGAIAYLTNENLLKSHNRKTSKFEPVGLKNNNFNLNSKQKFYNKGHIIAFHFLNNIDDEGNYLKGAHGTWGNRKNIFTQTSNSNLNEMKCVEDKITKELENKRKIIYSVSLFYQYDDDLVAKCIIIQAKSTDNLMKEINVCIGNNQPGFTISYKTGKVHNNTIIKNGTQNV